MTTPFNPIALSQEDIVSRLLADEYFADITVLSERTADLLNTIERALKVITAKGGKIGVAVVVGAFTADADQPNVPGPAWTNGASRVVVIEHPLMNQGATGTGKAAVDVAARAAQVLHHYLAGGIGQTMMVTGKDALVKVPDNQLDPGTIAYQIRVENSLDSLVLSKVATPTIRPDGGTVPRTVTLACTTSGAAIYYTTDLSYPSAVNVTHATRYTVPFTISAAATLRVVAHKTGLVASDSAAAVFT